ncbi:MAG: Mrp/NBP35 family ATP-binding protein [Myxococcota bacterium]|nr:Mrp/NBP35 family ATP-binding protein [Myxococcota bacterium]
MTDPLSILEPAATRVRDPLSNRSVYLAGMIQKPAYAGNKLSFELHFQKEHSREDRKLITESLKSNIQGQGFDGELEISMMVAGVRRGGGQAKLKMGGDQAPKKDPVRGMSGPGMQAHGGPVTLQPLQGVKHIIAVASGKGGVGKSTVSTNLAVALADMGYLVGILDADIYGPSVPLMLQVNGRPVAGPGKKILPLMAYGTKVMSIGFMVDETEPIIWRGPMVMGVIRQFLQDVAWAPLDYLIVDLPPGTGDTQLTMVQNVPISASIIVTTPQEVALLDARRGVEMFRKLNVPVMGVIENMSYLEAGGQRVYPFGQGGGERLAKELDVPLLGQVPLNPEIAKRGDDGSPAALAGEIGAPFKALAEAVADQVSI